MLRAPRPQRRGQDDDAAHAARAHGARRRDHHAPGAPGAAGRARGTHPRGRRAADGQPRPRFHGEREPARLRPLFRHEGGGGGRAPAEAARVRGAGVAGGQPHPGALRRDEAPPRARARPRERPGAHLPRRAHHRPRPAGAPPHVGAAAAAAAAGEDDPPHHALHGRGRAPLRPPRHHRPRPDAGARARRPRSSPSTSSPRWSRSTARASRRGSASTRRRSRRARSCTARPPSATCARRRRWSRTSRASRALRFLHRRANLEDLFLKLTGREMRE